MTEGRLEGHEGAQADEGGALAPYVIVLAVGVVIGLAVLANVALHRDEIIAILTQSPA